MVRVYHHTWRGRWLGTIFDRLVNEGALNGSEDQTIWNRSLRAFESDLEMFIQRLEAFPNEKSFEFNPC